MTDTLAFAWLSIARHRLRSLLAMVGVAVGMCALTSIISVEKSWRRAVTDFFSSMIQDQEDIERLEAQRGHGEEGHRPGAIEMVSQEREPVARLWPRSAGLHMYLRTVSSPGAS
jgi:hypothetical protein